jgi:hypothetical protein
MTTNFERVWAMPESDTFDCPPIHTLVKRYLRQSRVSIDPFARNKGWATHTNDLNPQTSAEYHLDVCDFLQQLKSQGVKADLVLFDPPYSPRQIKECYDGIGLKMGEMDAFRTHWKPERDLIHDILEIGGIVISLGWNSIGMGKKRGYAVQDILMVCHGPGHNDTLCIVERKQVYQSGMFNEPEPVLSEVAQCPLP